MLEPGKIYSVCDGISNFSNSFIKLGNWSIDFLLPNFKTGDKILILKEETNVIKLLHQKAFYWVFNLTQGRKMGLCIHNTLRQDSYTESRFKEVEF